MRILKLLIISFIVFFLLLTAMSLLIPGHIRISRAANFPAKNEVMTYIADTGKWVKWNPILQTKANKNEQTPWVTQWEKIKINDSLIVYRFHQKDGSSVLNSWELHPLASEDSVALQWYMDIHLPWYPWKKFGSLFYENVYGPMMEQGLGNLKKLN